MFTDFCYMVCILQKWSTHLDLVVVDTTIHNSMYLWLYKCILGYENRIHCINQKGKLFIDATL